MRAHETGHVERREPVEQAAPDDGDEPGRDHELRKLRKAPIAKLAAGVGPFEQPAQHGARRLHHMAVIEFRQMRKPRTFRHDQPQHLAALSAINLLDE